MLSLKSHGVAALLFFGQFAAVACGSDDDSAGPLGTAGAGRSGTAGAMSVPGTAGAGVAGANNDVAAGAGGVGGVGGAFDSGASYPCAGPDNASAGSGGQAGETGQASSALSCVEGQNFCFVFAGLAIDPRVGTVYVPECRPFSESVSECATTPTCDCLCKSFACETECRCQEVNGFPTMTCHQI